MGLRNLNKINGSIRPFCLFRTAVNYDNRQNLARGATGDAYEQTTSLTKVSKTQLQTAQLLVQEAKANQRTEQNFN